MAEPISVIDKIADATISEFTFKGDDGKEVKYKRLLLLVDFDGVSEEIEFAPSQGKLAYRLLQLADEQK